MATLGGGSVLKVLQVHNFYRSSAPSGENDVATTEVEMLRRFGHEVKCVNLYSDDLARGSKLRSIVSTLSAVMGIPWNEVERRRLATLIREEAPDVVHVHNSFPMFSPSIFYASKDVPFVLTLHNYRIYCPAGIPSRGGNSCTKCIDKRSSIYGVYHGCYRNKWFSTLPLFFLSELHRALGTWTRKVAIFIALTEFQRDLMVKGGLPFSKMMIKPNFFPGNPSAANVSDRREHFLFVGRLSKEKGVLTLLKAWSRMGAAAPKLRIAGDGPLLSEVKKQARAANVEILGRLSPSEVEREMKIARALVVPSEWFEGFPMVIREAFAFGTPVIASDIGSLSELITHGKTGLLFPPGQPDSLVMEVMELVNNNTLHRSLCNYSRKLFEEKYTEQVNYTALINAYTTAIQKNSLLVREREGD